MVLTSKATCLKYLRETIEWYCEDLKSLSFSVGNLPHVFLFDSNQLVCQASYKDLKATCKGLKDAVNFTAVLADTCLVSFKSIWDGEKIRLYVRETEEVAEVIKFDPNLLGDFFSDDLDSDIEPIIFAEVVKETIKLETESIKISKPLEIIEKVEPLTFDLPVYLASNNEEGKLVKRATSTTSNELIGVLDAWLSARNCKSQFLSELKESKYNSLVIYPYPAIEFIIDSSGKLTKKLVRSETITEIKNRAGSIIERRGRASSPIYSGLLYISPIRTKSKENTYLTQTYLKKTKGDFGDYWEQCSHNIAWFDQGKLHYYSDYHTQNSREELAATNQLHPVVTEHQLYPVIEADGISIFPDLSICKVGLEHLSPSTDGLWETTKGQRIFDALNQKPKDSEEIDRVSEKYLIKPKWFLGFDHPNLKAKKTDNATITERKIPKPIKLDGSRTNDHSYQLRAVVGNIPMLLTFENSNDLWQLIALPIRVSPYHLSVYLSDKVGTTELFSYIKNQLGDLNLTLTKNEVKIDELTKILADLPKNDRFLPGSRRLNVEIESLLKVSDGISSIIKSLDDLLLDIKSRKFPRPVDVLEATKIIEIALKSEHIKPESSYVDDYYCWHNIGTLRILEQIETVNPTYTLTVLGSERDTRRSKIPLVINWLRRVPQIIQKHFGEDYPTNEEIKSHLMSIYPFYKRRVRDGDKIDKSYVNLESEMIIRTKGKLIIEIYFNGDLQTTQLLSVTKPVDGSNRQGKIPVKISSTVEIRSLDVLNHLLRCTDRKVMFEVQRHIDKLVQKFVDSNIKLFSKEKEEKIVSRVGVKDLLGFSNDSLGYPQVVKQFNRFTVPYTSDSEVNIGKLVNLLTLQTYDRHDMQELLDKMVGNWKVWAKTKDLEIAGFNLTRKNPGDLMTNIHHTTKHNQDRSQVVWGSFIDELYLLSGLKVGFRTNDGVILTPWSLLSTDRKTWEHRIRIQLIDILSLNQQEAIDEVEALIKNARTKEEGKALRDNIRGSSVEAWLQMDIDNLYSALFKVRPNWRSLVHQNVLSHLTALHDALKVAEKV